MHRCPANQKILTLVLPPLKHQEDVVQEDQLLYKMNICQVQKVTLNSIYTIYTVYVFQTFSSLFLFKYYVQVYFLSLYNGLLFMLY